MTNPFISNKKLLVLYSVLSVLLTAAQYSVLYYVLDFSNSQAAADALVFNVIYFFLGISLWYPTVHFTPENYSAVRLFINHVSGAVLTSVIWLTMGYLVLTSIVEFENNLLFNTLIWRFFIGIFLYTLIVSMDYLIMYYNNFREKVLREKELNTLVKEAELKSLKYQIKPHFIFNSLNSISSLTMIDPNKAREMVIKLSEFMRSTLVENTTQKVPLADELKNVKLYLDIEKVRFEDKFEYVEEVSDLCKNVEVPNLILQPLLENAIKYGVYEHTDTVTITLTCKRQAEYMVITLTNNFDIEAIPKKGGGIGLNNIKSRLKLIYNRDNLLSVKNEDGVFRVVIFIPL